jgi:hypothetical protein
MTGDASPLTFGDSFTLPSTGEQVWRITDHRPHSYVPPENLTLPGRETTARAQCPSSVARYELGVGWFVYGEEPDGIIASELNQLHVHLEHRTDDEWRQIHLDDIRRETEQAISEVVPNYGGRLTHPLISDAVIIAHITATAAATAAKTNDNDLYQTVYGCTLAALRA